MREEQRSPRIHELEWGHVDVQTVGPENRGGTSRYRDAKLWPGGSRGWDWNETGTHHSPGIQPADVEELVEHGAQVIVLSKGQHERLKVMDETLQWLDQQGVEVEVMESRAAVRRYNELVKKGDKRVGALIHSTC